MAALKSTPQSRGRLVRKVQARTRGILAQFGKTTTSNALKFTEKHNRVTKPESTRKRTADLVRKIRKVAKPAGKAIRRVGKKTNNRFF